MITVNPDGIRAAKVTALKMALLAAILLAAIFSLFNYAFNFIRVYECVALAARIVLPFLPMVAFAYLAGCLEPGTKSRLEVRLISAVYLVAGLVLIVHAADMTVAGANPSGPGLQLSSLDVGADFSPVCYAMLVVPIYIALDALLEYVSARGTE